MKVSVIMSVYNDERFLRRSIESIINQTFNDFEFIIIDDGSTDSSTDILQYYSLKDQRIKVWRQTNSGMTKALNFGIKMATGKYIARMDSDDISFLNRLETEVNFLDQHSHIDLVGGDSQIIDDKDNIVGMRKIKVKNPNKAIEHLNIYQHSDVMFRRSILDKVGSYREKFRNAQDYDLWLRISEVSNIAKLPIILGQWRLNARGYTIAKNIEQKAESDLIKRYHRQRLKLGYDNYESYVPNPCFIALEIDENKYNYILGCYMIHSSNLKEGREKIKQYMVKSNLLHPKIFFIISYFPKRIVEQIFYFNDRYKVKFR